MKLPEFVSKRLGTFSGKPRRSDDAATYYTTRAASIATSAGTATISPATINAVPGATTVVNVTLKDNFKRAYANQTMSASVTGRNPTTVNKTALTDALGNVIYSGTYWTYDNPNKTIDYLI